MKIGFTGTRKGMSDIQYKKFKLLLAVLSDSVEELHHGDCIGADVACHNLALMLFGADNVIVHPPTNKRYAANVKEGRILPDREYHVRNADIVNSCDLLIACPHEYETKEGSGTWWTVEYAIQSHKPVFIITPDGRITVGE